MQSSNWDSNQHLSEQNNMSHMPLNAMMGSAMMGYNMMMPMPLGENSNMNDLDQQLPRSRHERDRRNRRSTDRERIRSDMSSSDHESLAQMEMSQINQMMMMQNNMMNMGMMNAQGMMIPDNMMMGGMFPDGNATDGNLTEYPVRAGAGIPMAIIDPSRIAVPAAPAQKELIKLSTCSLIPPFPGFIEMARRERPPGCKTIFVGGLPEAIERDTLREIFDRYGRVHSIRYSKKTFCHVRFNSESSVEKSFKLSGYRIKINEGTKDEALGSNVHVDYAVSRDDQQEYDRRVAREMRDREREMRDHGDRDSRRDRSPLLPLRRRRSPSPPKVIPLSNISVANAVAEQIKNESEFVKAAPTLIGWLERGEVNKRNCNTFYSMIQSTIGQYRRIMNEKLQIDEEYLAAKDKFKERFLSILAQFEQVEKILNAASHQRVSDHMTKPQRSRITTWVKLTEEIQTIKEEYTEKFEEDNDMDLDDKMEATVKQENDKLRMEVIAFKNELDVMKAEAKIEMDKLRSQYEAKAALENLNQNPSFLKEEKESDCDSKVAIGEARILTLLAGFLAVHPQGASFDYLLSYIQSIISTFNASTVDSILTKHTDIFQRKKLGVGANLEYRWHFIAFSPERSSY